MRKLDTKAVYHLFKIRNDQERWQKYDQNTITISLFNDVPVLPMYQRAMFSTDLITNRNLKSALDDIGYSYSFDKSVLTRLIEENLKDSEIPIIIACYQLISLLYTSNSTKEEEEQISTDDFSLFMQILNFKYLDEIQTEINFLFRSLLDLSLQAKDFEWTKDNINLVLTQFNQNKSLPNSFYPLFCSFASIIYNSKNRDDYFSTFIDFTVLVFQQKRELFETDKIYELIQYIKPLIFELDQKALYVLSEISKRIDYAPPGKAADQPRRSLFEIIDQLVPLFEGKTTTSTDKFLLSTKNDDSEKIHDLLDTFSPEKHENYKFEFQLVSEKLFQTDSIQKLPSGIISADRFSLFERFESETISNIDGFARFIENLDYKWSYHFLKYLNLFIIESCQKGEIKYQFVASFFALLKKLIDGNRINIDLSLYLPSYFGEKSSKPNLFESKNTVFGPCPLDPLLNDFRSAIIELLLLRNGEKISPKNIIVLFKLMKIQNDKPFLLTETLSRIISKAPIDDLLDSSDIIYDDVSTLLVTNNEASEMTIVENETVMKEPFSFVNDLLSTVSKTALILREMKAPIEPRNAISSIIIELLQNKSSFYACLTMIQFVDCLFAFVFENGLSQLFLNGIYKSLLLLSKNDKINPLSYLVDLMFQSIEFIEEKEIESNSNLDDYVVKIKEKIFDLVSFTIRLIPRLSKLYEKFVIPVLNDVHSVETMNRAIYMIIIYSSKHDFVLDMNIFNLLVEKIQYLKFIHIVNLLGLSTTLSSKSIFMIRRPCYLPLLFIMFCGENGSSEVNKNISFGEDVIEMLKELSSFSEYNRRALHDGKVDSILLSYVNNESPIYVKGVQIHLDYQDKLLKKDAWYLLNLIIPAKSSNEIVSHIISIMTSPTHVVSGVTNYYDIFNELYKIVSKSINYPKPAYDIGNIRVFCSAKNIDSTYFRDTTFTISFMMKADPLLLNRSTSQVMIVSIFDHSRKSLSVVLMNNGLYACYEANNTKTVVPLVQRSNPNEWAFYTFMFIYRKNKNGGDSYIITSYKNMERQHDSEFCSIKFDPSPDLSLLLGGYSYSQRGLRYYKERCATVANLSITPGAPKTREDIIDILLQNQKASINYIFTTNNFNKKLTNKTEKMIFNNREIEVKFSKNIFENTKVESFLPNYSVKLINSFKTIDKSMFKYITPLLSFSLQNIKSPELITKFSSILMSDDLSTDKLNFIFYKSLFDITSVLYNHEKNINENSRTVTKKRNKRETTSDSYPITDYWSKSIVYNIDIWKRSTDFPQILDFLSSTISNFYIQNLFSNQSDYFCYFLHRLNDIIDENKKENNEIIEKFIMFLSRVAYIKLVKEDCSKLFSLFCNIKSKDILPYYLKLVQNISQPIAKSGFKGLKDFSSIYSLIETYSSSETESADNTEQISIVVNLILVLHELYGDEFHTKVVKISRAFSSASSAFIKKLFTNLESLIDDYPNLFSLTTLIALQYRIIINSGVSKYPTKDRFSQSELWFMFPSLLALANFSPKMFSLENEDKAEENDSIKQSMKLFDFVVENSFEGESIDLVTSFIDLCSEKNIVSNSEYKVDENGYYRDSPLYYYLNCLISYVFDNKVDDRDVIFNVYFNTVASIMFHLNPKLLQYEKENMDPMQYLELIFVNKSSLEENIRYHICTVEVANHQKIYNKKLLDHLIQLGNRYNETPVSKEKLSENAKKPSLLSIGLNMFVSDASKNKKNPFTVQKMNEFLLMFKAKDESEQTPPKQFSIDKFNNMNMVFDWMFDTVKQKFRTSYNSTCDSVANKLLANITTKYPLFDKIEWLNYLKNNEKTVQPTKIEEEKPSFELLPILNFCYCPFLRRNNKVITERDEDEELENFFDGINHFSKEDLGYEPNAYNIIFGRKVPILFGIEQEGFYLNNKFISYSVFKFILSMNRGSSSSNKNDDKSDIVDNSILFILTNGVSFLLQFIENSSFFMQTIKKQKLPPNCFVAHSKNEMIEFLKPICTSWQSSIISTFDFLNVLNLVDGRTYLACDPSSTQTNDRHHPIFPSLEFLISDSKPKDQTKQFASPEIYYLIDEYPDAYENRKKLESSTIIHEFVQIAFPDFFANTSSNISPSQINQQSSNQPSANIHISPRNPLASKPVTFQKVDVRKVTVQALDTTSKISKKLTFVSKVNIPNYPPIFAFVFNSGQIVFGQVSFDKSNSLSFDLVTIKDYSLRKLATESRRYIDTISAKQGIVLKYAKKLKYAEYEKGIIIFDFFILHTISIKRLSSSPYSIPSVSPSSMTSGGPSSPPKGPPRSTPVQRRNSSNSSNSSIQLRLPVPDSSIISTFSQQITSDEGIASASSSSSSSAAAPNRAYAKLAVTEDMNTFFEQFLFAQEIFMKNPSTVSTGNFGQLDDSSVADLLIPAASVICLEQSRRFSVVAVGCDDGRVIIHAICPGVRISTIKTESNEASQKVVPLPVKLLLTDNCGLVLIYTSTSSLIVATLSGTKVKCIDHFNSIVSWFCFVPAKTQVDFVAFVGTRSGDGKKVCGGDNFLCVFEAARPDTVRCVAELPRNCARFEIQFDKLRNAFIVASTGGEIMVIPMPEIEDDH